jgi:hypothetical protein
MLPYYLTIKEDNMEAFGFPEGCCNAPFNLDIFYSHQFVANETTDHVIGDFNETVHILQKQPVLKGTLVGTVYRGTSPIQTFCADYEGNLKFTDVGRPVIKVVRGGLSPEQGRISLLWNTEPGSCHLVVSYEYNIQTDYQPKNVPQFVKPTFEKFFDSHELSDIARNAGTVCSWDFNTALGDTIMEKYESLYVKCYEVTNVLLKKGAAGYFWIVTSPEIASIFETSRGGFAPVSSKEFESNIIGGVMPLGMPVIDYKGAVSARWRLYTDGLMPSNMLLIGCNDTKECNSHYGRMMIFNFIV